MLLHNNKVRYNSVFLFLLFIGLFLCPGAALAQSIKERPSVIAKEKEEDTRLLDSINKAAADSVRLAYKGALTQIIEYSSNDSMVYDFGEADTLMIMYNGAKVVSKEEGLEIEADFFEMNRRTMEFFATGVPDSTGKIVGKPLFKQGEGEYRMDTLTYNYRSRKARILNVITKDGEGYLHGGITKRMPDNSTFIKGGKYTTCDHDHPHFYLYMTQGKVVEGNNQKVVFGPSYMVIEDVPIFPLALPFGFFPRLSDRSSGIKFPTYGEEVSRGFFLENLGFYLALGDYMDLDVTGSIYSLGSWSVRSAARYVKRYKFNGSFNIEYNSNVAGEKGSTDYVKQNDFRIQWSHSQSPKARPGTTFSASVNFTSIGQGRYNNQHDPNLAANNSTNSQITYSKTWEGTPFNFSTNFSHNQNNRDSTYTFNIPNFTFSVNRIFPFRQKERQGKKKLYEDISFTYKTTFDNRMTFKSSEFSDFDFMKQSQNGMQHQFGINLPSLTLFKYINLSPSVSYGMNWYFKKQEKHWDAAQNTTVTDDAEAFSSFGATHRYSFSASLDTRLYGMAMFKKGSMIEAVRHVVKPSISFSYTPNLRTHFNGWRTYQKGGSIYDTDEYNIYTGQMYSPPGDRESGSINFTLGNTVEMKVRNRKDTTATGGTKKISIFDNLNFQTSYDILADSLNWSDVRVNGSTNLLNKLNLNFGATFSLYDVGQTGQKINQFYWSRKGGLNFADLRSYDVTFGYSFNSAGGGSTNPTGNPNSGINDLSGIGGSNMPGNGDMMQQKDTETPPALNPFTYQKFDMPWSLTLNYTYRYTKNYQQVNGILKTKNDYTHTINFSGSVSPSSKWRIDFSSGFDFINKKIVPTTQLNIARDLHCFNFSFNWVPMGYMQSWSFRIAVTSSMLSDILKYEKRTSSWDNY